MLGVIIHYGVYSVYGYDDVNSLKRRRTQNGSEWYYGRVIEKNDFRPISGHKKTKEHHLINYGNTDYFEISNQITSNPQKVVEWVTFCKEIGAKYVILTAKHHDGFCLWNTKTTDRKSELDIVDIFVKECQKQNMEYGLYYSWFEFDKSFTVDYYNNYCEPQLNELLAYNPSIIWFDGQWKITQLSIVKKIKVLSRYLKLNNIKTNDRIPYQSRNDYYYQVGPDRCIPASKPNTNWQHVNTVGLSWGYLEELPKSLYKTGKELYELYEKVDDLEGDFLINIGPEGNGDICQYERNALTDLSQLINN
jgi:alpha-L-fucosidase